MRVLLIIFTLLVCMNAYGETSVKELTDKCNELYFYSSNKKFCDELVYNGTITTTHPYIPRVYECHKHHRKCSHK